MDERFQLKYKKVLEVLSDVAECTGENLILVGGTALALFHIKHRISVDLDLVPKKGDEVDLKERLKGCITNKGYTTQRAAHQNQFVILFEETGIKVEVFDPSHKIKKIEEHTVGNNKILVASMDDILKMKLESYSERLATRDLFDIVFILRENKAGFGLVNKIIEKHGLPEKVDEIEGMIPDKEDFGFFKKVIEDASKAGS